MKNSTTLQQLNKAANAPVRDTQVIADLLTRCRMEGIKINMLDYMGPARPLDLSNEGGKDHCSSAA